MKRDLVIISKHEKGFWQADLYLDGTAIPADEWEWVSPSPDGFFTLKRGATIHDAMRRAAEKWPNARIDGCFEANQDKPK